jgi:hypothetical protein
MKIQNIVRIMIILNQQFYHVAETVRPLRLAPIVLRNIARGNVRRDTNRALC